MNEALKRRALALGAKLEINGKTFNAARTQGQPVPRPKLEAVKVVTVTTPEPVPEPIPEIIDNEALKAIEQYAGVSYLLAQSNQKILQAVQQQLAQPAPKKVRSWTFKINRDFRGLLTSIEATAKE